MLLWSFIFKLQLIKTWLPLTWSYASLNISTGPNWTPLEVLAHLQGISMLHVVLLVPSLGRSTRCCWWGVVSVKLWVYSKTCMWVLDVDREMWSEVSAIFLIYDELHQKCVLYIHPTCCSHTCGCVPWIYCVASYTSQWCIYTECDIYRLAFTSGI